MTLGDIIKEYREEHGMSMNDFAKASGLSKGYISMLESNRNPKSGLPIAPSIQCIKHAADGMRMDFNVLFEKIDSDVNLTPEELSDFFQIPLVSHYLPDDGWKVEEELIGSVGVTKDLIKEGGYFAMYAPDNALSPSINEGDILIIHRETAFFSREIVAVCIDDEPAVCRILTRYVDGAILSSLQEDYGPEAYFGEEFGRLKFIGRVCESRRKF